MTDQIKKLSDITDNMSDDERAILILEDAISEIKTNPKETNIIFAVTNDSSDSMRMLLHNVSSSFVASTIDK